MEPDMGRKRDQCARKSRKACALDHKVQGGYRYRGAI